MNQTITHGFRRAVVWLSYMELGGAILIAIALGLVLGELTSDNLNHVANIIGIVALGVTLTFGGTAVYMERFDRRKTTRLLLNTLIAMVFVANSGRFLGWFNHTATDIIFSLASILTMIFVLMVSLKGYCIRFKHCPHVKG